MFPMNFTCKEFILNQRRPSILWNFNKSFITSLTLLTKRYFNFADKNEFVRYEFPKCNQNKDLARTKQKIFESSFSIIPDIVSINQELQFIDEIEKLLKRLRYQHDHWDDVINTIANNCFYFKSL